MGYFRYQIGRIHAIPITILGIESTCDETAAAVVVDGFDVRSNVVATQIELHAKYRGVVPEIASRAHIENILPVIREAMEQAGMPVEAGGLARLDAVAVAHRPGLIGSLLIGVTAAKTLAWALGKPLVGVDHVHAHLYSIKLENNRNPPLPAVGLVCSGGHTAMYAVRDWLDVELIGSTIDDAVGEAYDKVAAILGLGYPGGPIMDRLAAEGDPQAIRFPRTLLRRDSLDFSFSGLKTAVLYHVRGVPRRGENVKSEAVQAGAERECRIARHCGGLSAGVRRRPGGKAEARRPPDRRQIGRRRRRRLRQPRIAGGIVIFCGAGLFSADAILHGQCGHVRGAGALVPGRGEGERIGPGCDHV